MSNKIVPTTYRAIIDDVITNIRHEFDEFGVSESVLGDLQQKWEEKILHARVADFEAGGSAAPAPAVGPPAPAAANPFSNPPTAAHPQAYYTAAAAANPYMLAQLAAQQQQHANNGVQVKAEPLENNKYMLQNPQFTLPTLPGPTLPGQNGTVRPTLPNGLLSFPMPHSASASAVGQPKPPAGRIPQVDGPSDSDSSPPPPRTNHPSLPQASSSSKPKVARDDADPEAINSDLDDSDEEDDADKDNDTHDPQVDIVYCTYDKVARVKNKWKTTFKDGVVHVNGRDYLFAKCNGEFEW
ncbi:transcription factor IIA alpha/beta subunit [Flagelloscypha sp. PMI_526]|nr:transcription factor IIA alpha/beta subunit [Flagelloscypha sp. PMI_526]KAH8814480.1 transcription factor IIA alpha/beta subunit [Flagelloscypha sp. PMI_526]